MFHSCDSCCNIFSLLRRTNTRVQSSECSIHDEATSQGRWKTENRIKVIFGCGVACVIKIIPFHLGMKANYDFWKAITDFKSELKLKALV